LGIQNFKVELVMKIWFFLITLSKSFILARLEGLEPVLYMLACSNFEFDGVLVSII